MRCRFFGAQYACEVWLDPARLTNYRLTPSDVRAALLAQNRSRPDSSAARRPCPARASTPRSRRQGAVCRPWTSSRNILLRSSAQGGEVRLRDVARVEIGAENYGTVARFNGRTSSGMGIRLAAGADALETTEAVRAKLDEMRPISPPGWTASCLSTPRPSSRSPSSRWGGDLDRSRGAGLLVMYLFLQNLRATLIPTMAIPVVLLGTFGLMAAFGFPSTR